MKRPALYSLGLGTALLFSLGGCAGQTLMRPGEQGYLWQGNGRLSGPGTFVTRNCPPGKECTVVTVADAPPGQEAYSFVFKIKIRAAVGIPYGEEPVTVYVVGNAGECDHQATAQHLSAGGPTHEGNGHLSSDPSERCAGPVWIRQEGSQAAIQ